jgi:hypothetical protein
MQCDASSVTELSMAPTKPVSLRLAPDVVAWLTARAKADDRSLAYVVMRIVRAEMEREQKAKKRKATA